MMFYLNNGGVVMRYIMLILLMVLILPTLVSADRACQGICGDTNNDGMVNVSDAIWIINYMFIGGDPPQPVLACGDANGDAASALQDAVWIINYVFVGGNPPGDCSPGSPMWPPDGDCCPFQ
jgi:Dockerin type I domain